MLAAAIFGVLAMIGATALICGAILALGSIASALLPNS
jgi:hypothetical protein